MPSLTPGQSLGPDHVIRRLDAGGMGEVITSTVTVGALTLDPDLEIVH